MKAGTNTPQSVLAYIDAIWRQSAPPDPTVLARELGYNPKAFRRLKEKHGEGLVVHLERVKRERTETDRFMARQHGRAHPVQYVSSHHGAIDDVPAVPAYVQDRLTARANVRFMEHKRDNKAEEQAREDARRLAAATRDLLLMTARKGGDSGAIVERLKREIESCRIDVRDAA